MFAHGRDMNGDRVQFSAAGAAMRQARARAAARGLSPLEAQVLMTVFELTASWSKLSEPRTSARQIAALTYGVDVETVEGGQRRRVHDALKSLAAAGIIRLAAARGGRHAGVAVELPAANVLPAEHEGPANVLPPERQRAPGGTPNVFRGAGNTEKNEDPSEARRLTKQERRAHERDVDALLRVVDPLDEQDVIDHLTTKARQAGYQIPPDELDALLDRWRGAA